MRVFRFWDSQSTSIWKTIDFQRISSSLSPAHSLLEKEYGKSREDIMKKSTTLRALLTMVGCFFTIPSLTGWQELYAEAAVPLTQQPPPGCGDSEPMTDLKPGTLTNPQGVQVGAIKDFVLDLEAGRIAYTVGVFDHSGELGNRVFVIPWEAVKVDLETNTFTLSEDKIVLESTPSFALDTWANLPTLQWTGTVTAYWQEKLGHNFAAAGTAKSALSKASDLVGMAIKNLAGKDLGTIAELMLDPETGSIAYAVLSFEDTARSNRTVFFALPWDIVQVNPVQHTFVADVDKKMLTESRDVSHERLGSNSSVRNPHRSGSQTQQY
jgi:sporulation protein YlmC with PRC-barrel domain